MVQMIPNWLKITGVDYKSSIPEEIKTEARGVKQIHKLLKKYGDLDKALAHYKPVSTQVPPHVILRYLWQAIEEGKMEKIPGLTSEIMNEKIYELRRSYEIETNDRFDIVLLYS